MIECQVCSKSLPVTIAGNVRCACGHRFFAEGDGLTNPPANNRHLPCERLGPQVGTAECDCQTKPRVYACELHGLCMPRMTLAAAAVKMDDGTRATVSRSCLRCSDHSPA